MPANFCPHCGAKLKRPDADYCPKCDEPLTDEAAEYDDDEYDDEPPPPKKKKAKKQTLRMVASLQRQAMFCILAYFGAVFVSLMLPQNLRGAVGLAYLPVAIYAAVTVFRLANWVSPGGAGIAWGIVTLVPCVGVIGLLVVNGMATTMLKENGIRVGLLGASSDDIP